MLRTEPLKDRDPLSATVSSVGNLVTAQGKLLDQFVSGMGKTEQPSSSS